MASTPTDDPTDWMTANWPTPAVMVGSRSTAARDTFGATSLSSSSHLPLRLYSNWMKPLALPPGRTMLSTKPEPAESTMLTNTIGTERVTRNNGARAEEPATRMTSGASATSSSEYRRVSTALPEPQRYWIRTLRPSSHPS